MLNVGLGGEGAQPLCHPSAAAELVGAAAAEVLPGVNFKGAPLCCGSH